MKHQNCNHNEICEECSKRRIRETVIKYILLTIIGILLFSICTEDTLAERGRFAIGGEYLLLLLPLVYYVISDMTKEMVECIKFLFETEEQEEWEI